MTQKLCNLHYINIYHFIGKSFSFSVFCSLEHVSYAFVLVLLGSDRACLNTSISCWGNSTTHIRVIERSQMLSPSIISLETADYFLLNWLIWLLLLQCICTVLIKPKNQNIPKENILVIEKIMMYNFYFTTPTPPHPRLSHFGRFTLIVNHGAIYRRCKKKMLPENQWQPSFQK